MPSLNSVWTEQNKEFITLLQNVHKLLNFIKYNLLYKGGITDINIEKLTICMEEGKMNEFEKDFDVNINEESLENNQENLFEAEKQEVRIDLGGGYGAAEEVEAEFLTSDKESVYAKNVSYGKKYGKRFIAALVIISIVNAALLGGAFMLGRSFGANGRVASKQQLIETMQAPAQSGDATTVANTIGEMKTTEIVKKVGPAVVGITSVVQGQMGFFGTSSTSEAEGSGIILSADGYVVTNYHVVDGATTVKVMLNTGAEYEAKLIGKDEQTDLAVIKIEPKEQLVVATMGDSNALEVGERVVAIGNPMGLEFFGSVTEGIVSGVNRSIYVDSRTMNLIQTDAAINSGNSGGALINTRGEVIGINSVKIAYSGIEGMGFAIPSTEAKVIIADILEYGYVKGRPVIGISTRDVTPYMAQAYSWPQGVQVMEVSSETAKNAGLQQGDIITEVEGQKVTDSETLNKIKNEYSPGHHLKMKVFKYASGMTVDIEVILSEQIPG